MESLLKQVIDKPFKTSNFTVYSILEEDGFISELKGMFGKTYSVDDFEYVLIDLTDKEKNGILYRMSFMMNKLDDLKKFLEVEIQEDKQKTKTKLFVDKNKTFVFVASLKEFNLKERINSVKKSDELNSPSPE